VILLRAVTNIVLLSAISAGVRFSSVSTVILLGAVPNVVLLRAISAGVRLSRVSNAILLRAIPSVMLLSVISAVVGLRVVATVVCAGCSSGNCRAIIAAAHCPSFRSSMDACDTPGREWPPYLSVGAIKRN
jgi:hypothetical protein